MITVPQKGQKGKVRDERGHFVVGHSFLGDLSQPNHFQKGQAAPKTAFEAGSRPWNAGKAYLQIRDERHPLWKGDQVGYSALHTWVRRKRGKPERCEQCGTREGRIEWANKSHRYLRDLTDWIALCKPHHYQYDK